MHLKDYYSILQIEPSATLPEIKKAYRKLAQQFHPDKTHNDPYAAAQFTEVKEAYEVLTNPSQKEYYLQQRWYNQSIGKRKTQDVVTPVTMLKQALELERYVSFLDVFRMDKEGLFQYINTQFDSATIETLNRFGEEDINTQIVHTTLKTLKVLSTEQVKTIGEKLSGLSNLSAKSRQSITEFISSHAKKEKARTKELILIILITILICLLIWFSVK